MEGAIWGFALHQIVNGLMTYHFNALLGINDLKRDLSVLVALPLGYGGGLCINLFRSV